MGQDTESVVELVEVIAKSLVDEPGEVSVEAVDGARAAWWNCQCTRRTLAR